MNSIRVAIIGGGHLGRIHCRILKNCPVAQLVAVVDTDPDARELIHSEYFVETACDYRDLVGRVDAAIIATPTESHYPIAVHLLNHGIHTFVEKPITSTTPQADHLIQLADQNERVLQVGHVERFNPAFEKASKLLPGPRYLEAHRTSGYTFRSTDVGVVMDLMIHDIDLVLSMVRSPIVDTRAVGVAVIGPHEDIAQARLEFANGTVANLTASRCSFENRRSISWFSERGYVSADMASGAVDHVRLSDLIPTDQSRNVAALSDLQRMAVKHELFESVLPRSNHQSQPHNAIEQEQLDFLNAIREEGQPRVTGRHGRRAVSVAQSIIESIMHHRWQEGYGHRAGAQGQRVSLLPVAAVPNKEAA